MATDLKTVCYSLTESISGDFAYTGTNSIDSVEFNNGANWTDQTANITTTTTSGVNLLNISSINYGAVGSTWYFGKTTMFDTLALHFTTSTDNTTNRTTTWEYWNGSTWETLSQTGSTIRVGFPNSNAYLGNGTQHVIKFSPHMQGNWANTASISAAQLSANMYYVRCTVGVAAFTTATLATVGAYNQTEEIGFQGFDSVLQTNDATLANDIGVTFTDNTIAARSSATNAFTFTSSTTGARLYLGSITNNIDSIRFIVTSAGTNGIIAWEYWNGSSWSAINFYLYGAAASAIDTLENFRNASTVNLIFKNILSDWATTTVNGLSQYWIRARVSTTFAASPQFSLIAPTRYKTLASTVYIPETTNRSFLNVCAKIHVYNPTVATTAHSIIRSKIGSNTDTLINIPSPISTTAGFFSQIGGKVFTTTAASSPTATDGTFTDETSDASDTGTNDITVTNSINASIYFCYPNDSIWAEQDITLFIQQNSNTAYSGGLVEWEYWNGSAWTSFEPTIYGGGDKNMNWSTSSRSVYIPRLVNWATRTVNGFTGYIFRRRITQAYTTGGGSWTQVYTSLPGLYTNQYSTQGENISYSILVDITDKFKNEFSGTNNTVQLLVSTSSINSIYGDVPINDAELFITYTADTQNTRLKTAIIPLSTTSTELTTTLTSIGSNQIPQLSTYLPEASKTIRNFYVVVTGFDQLNTTIPTAYSFQLDSNPEKNTLHYHSDGGVATTIKMMYVNNSIDTSSSHDIKMAINSRHSNFKNWLMYAVVTYEYDASTTTRVLNTAILPFETPSINIPQDNPSFPERIRNTLYIQEPGTINNERVGCVLCFGDNGQPVLSIKEKDESSFTSYTWTAGPLNYGGFRYGFILPSQNLSRGQNTIGIDIYGNNNSAAPVGFYVCGYFIVNYQSDVASSGIENHNRPIYHFLTDSKINLYKNINKNRLSNPLTYWFINSIGFYGEAFNASTANQAVAQDVRLIYRTASSRYVLGSGGVIPDSSECIFGDIIMSDRDAIKKYPNDLHDHRTVDIFDTAAEWAVEYGVASINCQTCIFSTVHSIYYTINGTITGYSGDGSGLDVWFHDENTNELLFKVTSTVGGNFTAYWYDNTRQIRCHTYDAGVDKAARTPAGIAGVDNFDLNLNGGSGGTTSYAFIN